MFEPVKAGFGRYLGRFYGELVPTTQDMPEFINRGLAKSIAFAPTRMIDEAEEMLAAWQRNDTDQATTKPFKLPVILVAVAQDYVPTGRDFSRQIADSMPVIIPDDDKERVFGVRTVVADIRAQCVCFATNEPTAKSIMAQLALYLDSVDGRRFTAPFTFAGETTEWPVQIESPEVIASMVRTDVKNIVGLTLDLTLKATVPLYDAPKDGQPNDGKGIPGTDDPAGYPNIMEIDINNDRMVDKDGVHH